MSSIDNSASYEALDTQGRPYHRRPKCVDELPSQEMKMRALSEITTRLEDQLALVAFKNIAFGEPVYVAFGMSKPQAVANGASKLLLTRGCDISLDYAPTITQMLFSTSEADL